MQGPPSIIGVPRDSNQMSSYSYQQQYQQQQLRFQSLLYPFRYENGTDISANLFIAFITVASILISLNLFAWIKQQQQHVVAVAAASDRESQRSKTSTTSTSQALAFKPLINIRYIAKEIERLLSAVGMTVLLWCLMEYVGVVGMLESMVSEPLTTVAVDVQPVTVSSMLDVSTTIGKKHRMNEGNGVGEASTTMLRYRYSIIANRFINVLLLLALIVTVYYVITLALVYMSSRSLARRCTVDKRLTVLRDTVIDHFDSVCRQLMEIPWLLVTLSLLASWMMVRLYLDRKPIHSITGRPPFDHLVDTFHLLSLGALFASSVISYFCHQTLHYTMPTNQPTSTSTSTSPQAQLKKRQTSSPSRPTTTEENNDIQNRNKNKKKRNAQMTNDVGSAAHSVGQHEEISTQLDDHDDNDDQGAMIANDNINNVDDGDDGMMPTTINFDQKAIIMISQLIMIFQSIYFIIYLHSVMALINVKQQDDTQLSILTLEQSIRLLALIPTLLSLYIFQSRTASMLPICSMFSSSSVHHKTQ
ncbi:hypothetical protein SAMD00019534_078330, partial [Acytostelium subglobosum LB1]|uniref:hypothetical protein n=1 Tax=Acytostelium subglobosum LB1 TaxID=1410327 RepID=UPI0006452151